MFALLVLALLVAVLMENENEIVPRDSLLLGENNIENTLLEQD
jgi:hypothetical protein